LKIRRGAIVENMVFSLYAKFNDGRFWNEKALVLWKSDNNNPKNKNKNNNNNVGSACGPVFGSKKVKRECYATKVPLERFNWCDYYGGDVLQSLQWWAGWTSPGTWWRATVWSWNAPAGVGRLRTSRGGVSTRSAALRRIRRRRRSSVTPGPEYNWRSNTSPYRTTASTSVSQPTRSAPPTPPSLCGSKVSQVKRYR